MTIEKKLLGTSPSGGDAPNVADVFSTYLYEGNGTVIGSTNTITNGIDLDGEGGMVWIKSREDIDPHSLADTERPFGAYGYPLLDSATDGLPVDSNTNGVDQLNADGFRVFGSANKINASGHDYVSWTFRKAPRFFDVVTYTGNGTAGREIAHNLGVAPGMIFVKGTYVGSDDWSVYHRGIGNTGALELNTTGAVNTTNNWWDDTTPTSSVFTLGTDTQTNSSGGTYVAYLFAHDPDGEDDDGMIACGSFTADGGGEATVSLGWEPQYLLVKSSSGTGDWYINDTLRGFVVGGDNGRLRANLSDAEDLQNSGNPTADGFYFGGNIGVTYIYMAIRGPMMVEPKDATEVFAVDTADGTPLPQYKSNFPVDMAFHKVVTSSINAVTLGSRLTQGKGLVTSSTAAEFTESDQQYDYSDGWNNETSTLSSKYSWMFKRAKGFFDVVAYTGNGTAGRTVNHSLAVVPEMMIAKSRTETGDWFVYHSSPTEGISRLNTTVTPSTAGYWFGNGTVIVSPTSTVFTLGGSGDINSNTENYIAYLFATLEGVSKVGSYTGNGSNQNIACGFSAGARFVMIKRTDSTGDWYIWDTERGIVAGNDPHLSLNTTAAQVTSDDSIDPQSAGFTVNQVSATNINVSSATYIFLAIA